MDSRESWIYKFVIHDVHFTDGCFFSHFLFHVFVVENVTSLCCYISWELHLRSEDRFSCFRSSCTVFSRFLSLCQPRLRSEATSIGHSFVSAILSHSMMLSKESCMLWVFTDFVLFVIDIPFIPLQSNWEQSRVLDPSLCSLKTWLVWKFQIISLYVLFDITRCTDIIVGGWNKWALYDLVPKCSQIKQACWNVCRFLVSVQCLVKWSSSMYYHYIYCIMHLNSIGQLIAIQFWDSSRRITSSQRKWRIHSRGQQEDPKGPSWCKTEL